MRLNQPGLRLQVGGKLIPDKHIYIEREADGQLRTLLQGGEYCNILCSRQTGKSSLVAQVTQHLRGENVAVASIDLTAIGTPATAYDWYSAFLSAVADELGIRGRKSVRARTPNQRFLKFFKEVVGRQIASPVVIFVDEIDYTLKLPYTDDFFIAIRAMYNQRDQAAAYQRITFCLVGVATPSELIKDRHITPYNIGTTIELYDFDTKRNDLRPLYRAVSADTSRGEQIVQAVLRWTGGHPYLTTALCRSAERGGFTSPAEVNDYVGRLIREPSANMELRSNFEYISNFLSNRISERFATLKLYQAVRGGEAVRDLVAMPQINLKLAGIVKRGPDGVLAVRNQIYEKYFDEEWVSNALRVGAMDGPPFGLKLRHSLRGHTSWVSQVDWSPDHRALASSSYDGTIRLWNADTGDLLATIVAEDTAYCVTWSPEGRIIASGIGDHKIQLWDADGTQLRTLEGHTAIVHSIHWSPDGRVIASGSEDKTVALFNVVTGKLFRQLRGHGAVRCVRWSPDAKLLAFASSDNTVRIWDAEGDGQSLLTLVGHIRSVNTVAWAPDRRTIASGADDWTIRIWDVKTGNEQSVLGGHTGAVTSVVFSSDGRLLASKSSDGSVRIWRTETGNQVSVIREITSNDLLRNSNIAFHPALPALATLDDGDIAIRIWDYDPTALSGATNLMAAVSYSSAKLVLIGESNVGKSCLAMRLAEDRYEELGSTHGMRFWQLNPEHLSEKVKVPEGQRRDVVLWDLGGQEEYRLVHQLFLHDTTLALFLLDPTRGQTAFEEVEAWNKRLAKQLGARPVVKLLVGTKLDEDNALVDRRAVEQLISAGGFAGYYETSSKTGRGLNELREGIVSSLNWEELPKTIRPKLFQRIRDEIELDRTTGKVVLLLSDLERRILEGAPEMYEAGAVEAVTSQLATQGVIAYTRLATGERVLVLNIEEIERYAGSLIIAARNNPHDIPALEERQLASPDVPLPGIREEGRLPRLQERIIIECVVQLLVEHGVCFRHEGLLIFPSLFRPTEKEIGAALPHAVSLYYDFSGAVDNIYASLVISLAIGKDFGRVRLWKDRAEFEAAGHGACGVRKIDRGSGFAHIDIYFEERTPQPTRELFISFVEDHLRRHDVEVTEHIEISCPNCGYQFAERAVRERIARGESDIGCVNCDYRVDLASGARKERELNAALERRTVALRTKVEENVRRAAQAVKQFFKQTDEELSADAPLRVLHLSDLHFGEEADVLKSLRPLVADIRDASGGLGFERLDYLVISGDLTNRATQAEFEAAHQFTSGLIEAFELTAQRCVVVPGNHDLSWDEEVYTWISKRRASLNALKAEHVREIGEGYLVRDEQRYPRRFNNFSRFFYHPLFQVEYPLAPADQGIPYFFPETGLQFLAFNSAWEVDEWFPDRAGINEGAVARALEKADRQVKQHLSAEGRLLRVGVWHHPLVGNEKMRDDAFLQQLRHANVALALHGHVHEDRIDSVGYMHTRGLRIVAAGSFGAAALGRPESTLRLYNLLEIARDHSTVRVHTRCLHKNGGAWEGWAVWPGDRDNERRTFYNLNLSR